MAEYYNHILDTTNLSTKSGSDVELPLEVYLLAARVVSTCNHTQSLIQTLIYSSHAARTGNAKEVMKDFPSPKARLEFLYSFPIISDDPEVSLVFDYAKNKFATVYTFRNAIAHETWQSSAAYPNTLLLSSLNEQARLSFASQQLYHADEITSEQIYHASVRYIHSVKLVGLLDLQSALQDLELCNWVFMQLCFVLEADTSEKKEELKTAFKIYNGTSHLFPADQRLTDTLATSQRKHKSIDY